MQMHVTDVSIRFLSPVEVLGSDGESQSNKTKTTDNTITTSQLHSTGRKVISGFNQ